MFRKALVLIWVLGSALVAIAPGAAAYSDSQSWAPPVGSALRPTVLTAFAPPAERWLAGHRGVDLVAGAGSQVRAAGAGTVTFTGMLAGRGVVTITHGELRTTYEPVISLVHTGQVVQVGDAIGEIGSGGHCSLHCLHWGLLRGDDYLDPMQLLGLRPPVLKSPRQSGIRGRTTPVHSRRAEGGAVGSARQTKTEESRRRAANARSSALVTPTATPAEGSTKPGHPDDSAGVDATGMASVAALALTGFGGAVFAIRRRWRWTT